MHRNRNLFRLSVGILLLLELPAFAQRITFAIPPAATDSAYGYIVEKPLQMKQRNADKSIPYTYTFLSGLRTTSGQKLNLVSRGSLENPRAQKGRIKNRFTGLPLGGNLGILDRYTFITDRTGDTVVLFVDLYKKGILQVPAGLVYEPTEN
jgi:hypothetical protein